MKTLIKSSLATLILAAALSSCSTQSTAGRQTDSNRNTVAYHSQHQHQQMDTMGYRQGSNRP